MNKMLNHDLLGHHFCQSPFHGCSTRQQHLPWSHAMPLLASIKIHLLLIERLQAVTDSSQATVSIVITDLESDTLQQICITACWSNYSLLWWNKCELSVNQSVSWRSCCVVGQSLCCLLEVQSVIAMSVYVKCSYYVLTTSQLEGLRLWWGNASHSDVGKKVWEGSPQTWIHPKQFPNQSLFVECACWLLSLPFWCLS